MISFNSIQSKLILIATVCVVPVVGNIGSAYWLGERMIEVERESARLSLVDEAAGDAVLALTEVRLELMEALVDAESAVVPPGRKDAINSGLERFRAGLGAVRADSSLPADIRQAAAGVEAKLGALEKAMAELAPAIEGRAGDAALAELDDRIDAIGVEMTAGLQSIEKDMQQLFDQQMHLLEKTTRDSEYISIAIGTLLLLIVGVSFAVLKWSLFRELYRVRDLFASRSAQVEQSLGEVDSSVGSVGAATAETSAQSGVIKQNAAQVSANVQSVAQAVSELNLSIQDISRSVSETSGAIERAVEEAAQTKRTMDAMRMASQKIGTVVSLINDLAEQTNLLALNAAIEAARAGDAGRGFAVVADEVKKLAGDTSKATDDIVNQVNEVQRVVEETVLSLDKVVEALNLVAAGAGTISAAIEEQSSVTRTISESIQNTETEAAKVTTNMSEVDIAVGSIGESMDTLTGLSRNATTSMIGLKKEIDGVLWKMGIR